MFGVYSTATDTISHDLNYNRRTFTKMNQFNHNML